MEKGKQVAVNNKRTREATSSDDEDAYIEVLKIHNANEIQKLHKHYKGKIDRMQNEIRAMDAAYRAMVKYERKNAKVKVLCKQISAIDFDMESEFNRLCAKEKKLYEEWEQMSFPDVESEQDGSGGPSRG